MATGGALLRLTHLQYIGTLRAGASELIWSLFHFPASKSESLRRFMPMNGLTSAFSIVYVNSLLALYVPVPTYRAPNSDQQRCRLNVRHWLRESHYAESVHLESLRGGIRYVEPLLWPLAPALIPGNSVQRTGDRWRSIVRTDPGVLITTETQIMQDEDHRGRPQQEFDPDADPDKKVVA